MAPKSRRKKKYSGQRSPQVAPASVARPATPASRPTPAGPPPARSMPAAPRVQAQLPSLSVATVGREIRTIALLAGALLVVLVVVSLVLK